MKYKILDFIASDSDEAIVVSVGLYLFLSQQKSQYTRPPEL